MNKSGQFIIRDFRNDDFPEITRIWEETGMGGAERNDDLSTINDTIHLGGKLIVLEMTEKNKIIGTSWLTLDGRRIYLHHFAIRKAYQGKGFSKPLLEKSFEFARNKGLQLKLEVHRDNDTAIKLYREAGFKYLGDYLVFIIRDVKNL